MDEVTGPIIAIALVLCAVFVPTAFISGLTGQFYRQFALTIAISTVISAFNSLTLSPGARRALLLKAHDAPPDRLHARHRRARSAGSSAPFNRFFARASNALRRAASRACCARARIALVVYVGLIGAHRRSASPRCRPASCRRRTSSTSSPSRSCRTPRRSTAPRRVIRADVDDRARRHPGVEHAVAFPGLSINGFVERAEHRHRVHDAQAVRGAHATRRSRAGGIAMALNQQFARHPGRVHRDLPAAAGAGARHDRRLQAARSRTAAASASTSSTSRSQDVIAKARASGRSSPACSPASRSTCRRSTSTSIARRRRPHGVPLHRRLRHAAGLSRLALRQRLQPLRPHLPGQRAGRAALPPEPRATSRRLKTRNARGDDGAARLASSTRTQTSGPDQRDALQRLSRRRDQRRPRAGHSARARRRPRSTTCSRRTLPNGMTYEWTELTYQQMHRRQHDGLRSSRCACCSCSSCSRRSTRAWSLPLVVILIVPMCLLCAIAGVWLTRTATTTSSRRSASSCSSASRARTRS